MRFECSNSLRGHANAHMHSLLSNIQQYNNTVCTCLGATALLQAYFTVEGSSSLRLCVFLAQQIVPWWGGEMSQDTDRCLQEEPLETHREAGCRCKSTACPFPRIVLCRGYRFRWHSPLLPPSLPPSRSSIVASLTTKMRHICYTDHSSFSVFRVMNHYVHVHVVVEASRDEIPDRV